MAKTSFLPAALVAPEGETPEERKRRETAEITERIRVAHERMQREGARRNVPLSNERKAVFIAALQSGLLILDAAEVAGVAVSTLYRTRNIEPEFARMWDDANEASLQPIEQRLESIALSGDPSSMATVRAAEVTLKHRAARRYNQGGTRVEMKSGPDGGSLSVRVGTPGGD